MNLRTVNDVKHELSRIAGVTGFRVTDDRFLAKLNGAILELMHEGDWPGIVDRYQFRVYGGVITLPGDLERIMGICADDLPLEMRSPWYEFVQDGPGPQGEGRFVDVAIDRGEACTFRPIPVDGTEYSLRVLGQVDERVSGLRPRIIVKGYDTDGQWVRSQVNGVWIDGVSIEINGDAHPIYETTDQAWSFVESVVKPATRGYVYLQAVRGDVVQHLATYAPKETLPSYRQYLVPVLDPSSAHRVIVRARKRFVPVAAGTDYLLVSNLGALESMVGALQKRETDDFAGYAALKGIAIDLLRKEAASYLGKTRKPAITFAAGFGFGNVPNLR